MSRPERFLNTSSYKLIAVSDLPYDEDDPQYDPDDPQYDPDDPYAILSHRWIGTEVTYGTHKAEQLRDPSQAPSKLRPALEKIRGACGIAKGKGIKWLWSDTCCINKSDAVERDRSINSMFEWYENAAICYAYLYDVDAGVPGSRRQPFKSQNKDVKARAILRGIEDPESEWFERGWTLQELLAPREMEFYDSRWALIDTKRNLADELQRITRIDKMYLIDNSQIHSASLATRMSWMAGRTTKELEDIAYSMLGIFGISMTPKYNDREKAFMELQKILLETFPKDESIFAWALPADGLECFRKLVGKGETQTWQIPTWRPSEWGMLAPSPDCFKASVNVVVITNRIVERLEGGIRCVPQGVQFRMPVKPFSEATNFFGLERTEVKLPLNCWINTGEQPTVIVRLTGRNNVYKQCQLKETLEAKTGAKPSANTMLGIDQVVSKPLTITQPVYSIPK